MESIAVIESVGGKGWALLITQDVGVAESWIDEVHRHGWTPLAAVIADRSYPSGQDDFLVRIHPDDLPSLARARFPAGSPLHMLDVDVETLDSTLLEQKPWAIAAPLGSQIAGYRHIRDGQRSWWIHPDQSHLAPGISSALGRPEESRDRARTRFLGIARRLLHSLPGPVRANVIRRRHLSAVELNLPLFTDESFLGRSASGEVTWITPGELPAMPSSGFSFDPLGNSEVIEVEAWLRNPHDSDVELDRRMDNNGDELGRLRAALRTRLRLTGVEVAEHSSHTTRRGPVVFDARALQSPAFGTRGIGRFAYAALSAVREGIGDDSCILLVDPALEPLPIDVRGSCRQMSVIPTKEAAGDIARVIQPSPMTASPDPLIPMLIAGVPSLAVVFDFIPAHHPGVYLGHPAARAEYAAQVDALVLFQEYVCISQIVADELMELLAHRGRSVNTGAIHVAWPGHVDAQAKGSDQGDHRHDPNGPIVLMTGDDPRKNTFVGLAAAGAATTGERSRDIRVLGMAGQDVRVHHISIAAALRPGEAVVLDRISDEQMSELVGAASVVVVPSFDEGLSLPVIEAVAKGVPVVASDIPAHRELLGTGAFLASPGDIAAFGEAIQRTRGKRSVATSQGKTLSSHPHENLETVIAGFLRRHPPSRDVNPGLTRGESRPPLRLAVATPWPPQASGIADYSQATMSALGRRADLTVFTTADGCVEGLPHRDLDSLLDSLEEFDAVLYVLGNSHYHLTISQVLGDHRRYSQVPAIVLAHDTRMVEFYAALRGIGGARELMTRGQVQRHLSPEFEQQLEDMRLLQNAGLWEIARQADRLLIHSPTSAARIAAETGVAPVVLPFAHYRTPPFETASDPLRQAAREALSLDRDVLALATFGYVDVRTKLTDVVVESAAWLSQWGHRVSLSIVGSSHPDQERALIARAQQAGIEDFRITGFVSEEVYRQYLLGIDLGVQLRISPLLGVSGPLADMAAFGTRAIASRGVAADVRTPPFIRTLPDDVSSLMVAEAIEEILQVPFSVDAIESHRRKYLRDTDPTIYADELLEVVTETLRQVKE